MLYFLLRIKYPIVAASTSHPVGFRSPLAKLEINCSENCYIQLFSRRLHSLCFRLATTGPEDTSVFRTILLLLVVPSGYLPPSLSSCSCLCPISAKLYFHRQRQFNNNRCVCVRASLNVIDRNRQLKLTSKDCKIKLCFRFATSKNQNHEPVT